MLVPGTKLPEFKARACVSLDAGKEFVDLSTKDALGKWLVLYTYPKDFTFVCPTEIVAFDDKLEAFKQRNALVWGGSTDNEYSHLAWRKDNAELKGLRHPLVFVHAALAQQLGILHPSAGAALRATLIIDPDGVVRHASANDLSVGRSVDEVLRVLDGLQTGELVACGWKKGDETLSQKLKKNKK